MNTTLGERLRELRLEKGLSQFELAAIGGAKNRRTQFSYEIGEHKPNSDYLHRLSLAGFDTHYLMTGNRFELPKMPERGPGYSDEGWAIFTNGWEACAKALSCSGLFGAPKESPRDTCTQIPAQLSDFEKKLLRLKQALGVTEDQAVAQLLGMSKAAFSARKVGNSFPIEKLKAFALDHPEFRLDTQFVLTGVAA